MIALLLGMALAAEPTDGVKVVPQGTVLTYPGGPRYTVPAKAFLLPEPYYDTALTKATQLEICQPALDACTVTSTEALSRVEATMKACEVQFGQDATQILDLTSQVQALEARALKAEAKLKSARRSQVTAWGVAGGLVLGAVVVISLD